MVSPLKTKDLDFFPRDAVPASSAIDRAGRTLSCNQSITWLLKGTLRSKEASQISSADEVDVRTAGEREKHSAQPHT
ncbi:hypothetical protein GUJ93_ZPchr0002g24710 [Zizania palustris]|uniref:Uncharacterized protein n=1 Tax=Zizania palustris TaxID=103762 RepID=A0A8J5VES0_ZIZPA|nr:hypothetical protein GUJ93_ZPchr0002g24710 [Zizania palustris]